MPKLISSNRFVLSSALAILAGLALFIDLTTPVARGFGIAYLTIALATFWLPGVAGTLVPTLACTALVLFEPLLDWRSLSVPVFWERGAMLVAIWVTASLVLLYKRSQSELQDNRQHLQSLYDEAPDAYAIMAKDGSLRSLNRSGLALLELDRLAADTNLCHYVHPDDCATLAQTIGETGNAPNHSVAAEFRLRSAQGYRWIAGRFTAATSPSVGDPDIRATWRDIHETKTAEAARRESDEHFRNLVENSIQGIIIHRAWKPLFVNRALARMLGYSSPQEILELGSIKALIDPDESTRLADLHRQTLEHGHDGRTDYEFIGRRKDGSQIVLRNLGRVVSWSGRTAIQSAIVDVTDAHVVHQALEHSEQRFREFSEIAADWFWETDADLNFTYVSGRVESLTGRSSSALIGTGLIDALARDAEDPHARRRLGEDLAAQRAFSGVELPMIGERGLVRIIRSNGRPMIDIEGRFLGYRGVGRDATVEHRMAQKVAHQATHDSLTGLVNRLEFEQRLARALDKAKHHGQHHALCYLDLDQFKVVNDTAGHVAGDELLRQLTGVLLARIRQRDTLARQGGDEFALLLENCSLQKSLQIAESLVQAINDFRFSWEGRTFEIGVSIGVVEVTADALNTVQLLSRADAACYTAKDQGRRQVFSPDLQRPGQSDRHSDILRATELRDALEADRFELYCQPIYPVRPESGDPIHYELLLRMRDTQGGLLAPGEFIAAAERYGLMAAVDRWVINHAFQHFSAEPWIRRPPQISINLSGNSLSDDGLLTFVQLQLEASRLRPGNICFEITETAAISNLTRATGFIESLRGIGCRFALDDFGSGLSSFGYLKNLPVDYLKIDGAFVRDLLGNPIDKATVSAINEVGHVMGIKTVAEFVESDAILDCLYGIGVDYAQGYGLCRPVPLSEVANIPQWTAEYRRSV